MINITIQPPVVLLIILPHIVVTMDKPQSSSFFVTQISANQLRKHECHLLFTTNPSTEKSIIKQWNIDIDNQPDINGLPMQATKTKPPLFTATNATNQLDDFYTLTIDTQNTQASFAILIINNEKNSIKLNISTNNNNNNENSILKVLHVLNTINKQTVHFYLDPNNPLSLKRLFLQPFLHSNTNFNNIKLALHTHDIKYTFWNIFNESTRFETHPNKTSITQDNYLNYLNGINPASETQINILPEQPITQNTSQTSTKLTNPIQTNQKSSTINQKPNNFPQNPKSHYIIKATIITMIISLLAYIRYRGSWLQRYF